MKPSFLSAFAPTGRLRAAINLGNALLACKDPVSGQPAGVSIDIAQAFASRLAVPLELVVFDTAAKSVEAVRKEQADIGFFAIDLLRGEGISFTAPYLLIEGAYLVRNKSSLQSNEEVDKPGIRVAAGAGSAYDLYLSRELKHAEIVRAGNSQAVVDTFMLTGLDVAAGVKQQLQADAQRIPGLRLLPGRFMVIQQAMVTPQSRGQAAAALLADFVEELKASGFVANALERHDIKGVTVAGLRG